jgi:hypothetical protein
MIRMSHRGTSTMPKRRFTVDELPAFDAAPYLESEVAIGMNRRIGSLAKRRNPKCI